MTARTILITGAGGFTGRHACRKFLNAGWDVIGIVSPRSPAGDGIEASHVERCDLTDGAAVMRLLKRMEPTAVLHAAGRNAVDFSWKDPASTIAANFMSTVYILEAVRAIGSCKVLIIGSMLRSEQEGISVPAHPYGFSKTLQVEVAKAWHHLYGLPVMVAEPSNLVGPGGSAGLCGKIARWTIAAEEAGGQLPPFQLSSLHEARDFLDVRDAVSAYEIVLEDGDHGRNYALESGAFRTLGEVRQAFDEASSIVLPWVIGNDASRPSPAARDTSSIRELGWKPVYSFRQSIRDALEDERKRRQRERGGSSSDRMA